MKKTTKIFGLLLTLFGLALVTGCTPITDTPYVPEETTYTVTIISESTNGTVSADKTDKIAAGETITLTVTPNDGYELDTPSVKNGDIDITITQDSSDVTKYTFTMPAGNVTITVTFKETAETISRKAVEAVIAEINKIGTVEYTVESKTLIDNARKAYDTLTDEQKALVTNYETLTTAEKSYSDLKTTVDNQAAAVDVITKINAIGTVAYTDICKAKIDAARAAYDALTNDQKALVTNYSTLTDAESVYTSLILYTIKVNTISKGTVTIDKTSAKAGEPITLTVTPDAGYELKEITVNGTKITGNTFTMPAGNVTVIATFKEIIREYYVKFYSRNTGKEFIDIKKTVLQNALGVSSNYSNEKYTIYGVTPNGDELKELFNLIKYLARYAKDNGNSTEISFSASSALPESGYDALFQLSLVEIENNSIIKIYFDTIVTPNMTMATR